MVKEVVDKYGDKFGDKRYLCAEKPVDFPENEEWLDLRALRSIMEVLPE